MWTREQNTEQPAISSGSLNKKKHCSIHSSTAPKKITAQLIGKTKEKAHSYPQSTKNHYSQN